MANQYINIWLEGATPGTFNVCASSDGSGSVPISIGPLNVATGDAQQKRVLLKTEAGFVTINGQPVTVQPVGTNAAKWALAPDNAGAPGVFQAAGTALTISTQINTTGVYFWVKAIADINEVVQNDATVDLKVSYGVVAA